MAIVLSQIQVILVRIVKGHVFKANSGWLAKFKARHGIRKLMLFQKLQNDAKKRSAYLKQLSMNDFVL